MKTVSFYGASDDLVEVDGIPGADEFDVCGEVPLMATFVIRAREDEDDEQAMAVHAIFSGGGVWSFAPSQVEDGVPLPSWPIRITQSRECNYSVLLEIDVPDNANLVELVKVWPEEAA